MTFLTLLIYALACYRLALMLSQDSGPYAVFSKLRSFLKREAKTNKPLRASKVHLGIACIRCDSVWVASSIATYAVFRPLLPGWFSAGVDCLLLGLALSAAAILMNRILPPK